MNPITGATPTVANGRLLVPLRQADLYAANGNAQLLLQQAPAGSWKATAKVVHAGLTADGEALGLGLINSFNPNHFVKATVQYKNDTDPNTSGNQPGKWAERVLTSNNAAITLPPATVPYPNSGALAVNGDYVWVRLAYDDAAKTVTTATSLGRHDVHDVRRADLDDAVPQPAGGLRDRRVRQARRPLRRTRPSSSSRSRSRPTAAAAAATRRRRRTTHVLDSGDAGRDGGYYKSDVKVTLDRDRQQRRLGRRQDRVPRAGRRELDRVQRLRSTSPATARTRSSTARSTRRATSRRPSRSRSSSTRPARSTTAKLNGEAPKASYTVTSRSTWTPRTRPRA